MNAGKLGGLLGLLAAGGLVEDEAEAAAVPGFAKMYAQAVANGRRGLMNAGTLEDDVFQKAMRRDNAINNNQVFVSTHAGNQRANAGEMQPFEVGQHIENMLNSVDTRVMPNFPTQNYRNNAGGMLYLNDGQDVVAPFMAGNSGEVILKTAFQPTGKNRKFVENFLGVPPLSISGPRDKIPSSAQQLGFSADRKLSMDTTLSGGNAQSKSKLPSIAGAGTGVALGSMPQEAHLEAPLESPWLDPVDMLIATVGAPGVAAKFAAAALAPAWNYATDRLGGLLGKFFEDGK